MPHDPTPVVFAARTGMRMDVRCSEVSCRWIPLHQFVDPSQGSFQQQRPEVVSAVRFPALGPASGFWSNKVIQPAVQSSPVHVLA